MDIDFIIYWVDGSDMEWQKKKTFYKGTEVQNSSVRYRDWDILKYWFRAVEQYAPWVHRIYFVADNQRPKWLNFEHPKLKYVDHQDFIPHEYLPTFQANTIELNFHRIKGLSEYFVVFNDDMYINGPVDPEYYFKGGLPCDAPYEHIFTPKCYYPDIDGWGINLMEFGDIQVINRHFNRINTVNANIKGWFGLYLGIKYQMQSLIISLFRRTEFQRFYTPHNEKPFLKSIYNKLWEKERGILSKSCTQFREDFSLNNYLFRYWQLAENNFSPKNVMKYRKVVQLEMQNIHEIEQYMFSDRIKSICLNDSSKTTLKEYEEMKPILVRLWEKKLPQKSSFEL